MILGDSTLWRRRLIDVHELVLARLAVAWSRHVGRFGPATLEDAITDQLVWALQRDQVLGKRFLVTPQYKLLDEDRRGDVVTKGVIDVAVFFHLRNDVYLAFECKRLSVRRSQGRESLAGKYVEEGMMRYVSARYAQRLPLGAMLGYVMDGDVRWAEERLRGAVERRAEKLRLVESLKELPAVSVRCLGSRHRRADGGSPFEIRHVLLAVSA